MTDEERRAALGEFVPEPTPITNTRADDGGDKRPCLLRITGAELGEVLVVEGELVIGRDLDIGISVPHDRGASRRHAKIVELPGGGAKLVDLGSTNGTYVDGVRVDEKLLVEGDKIRVGQTTVLKYARYDDAELKMQRRLVEEALRDGLTRVFNRRYFMDRLEAEIGFADRHRIPLSIALFDVDHFKTINDEHGHLVGDRILTDLATVCARTVRAEDVLARYGGEEFIVLLRGITIDGALRAAERMRRAVELAELAHDLSPPRALTISVGTATLMPQDYRPLSTARERIITATDQALYRAKNAGRNVCRT